MLVRARALDTETIAYDIDGTPGVDFTHVLGRSQDSLMRSTGYQLKTENLALETSSSYTYGSTDGRLSTVAGASGSGSFQYSYLPNSNLIENITGPTHTVANTWELTRNVLAAKENKVGTTVNSSYTYNVNHLGQRTGVNKAGTAFASTRSIDWGYNAQGEVVKADSSVTGFDRAYQYDGIGNRLKSADSLTLPTSNNYTPNALNQYTAITQGSAGVSPAYDDDGNATAYPLPANPGSNSTLVWDAENRLTSTTVNSVTTTYLYDSQSRRIAQTVGTGGPAGPTIVYIYDGWNPIAEYEQSGTGILPVISKTYTWGMDLSGSMQGAGGVGGLLAVTSHFSLGTSHFFPTYDGNGNVSEYLDSTGAIAAHYEYDPFGRETVSNGTSPTAFAHRFSTKPVDSTTGLLYYGYRYYDPTTGRWPSRDPIEEEGGINLYGFVGNDSVIGFDVLGMEYEVICRQKAQAVLDNCNDGGWGNACKQEADRVWKECMDNHGGDPPTQPDVFLDDYQNNCSKDCDEETRRRIIAELYTLVSLMQIGRLQNFRGDNWIDNYLDWNNCSDDANNCVFYCQSCPTQIRNWYIDVQGGRDVLFQHYVVKIIAKEDAKKCGFKDLYYDAWNSFIEGPPRDHLGYWDKFHKKWPRKPWREMWDDFIFL